MSTVLVVELDDDLSDALSVTLESAGFHCVLARDDATALQSLRDRPSIEIVAVDVGRHDPRTSALLDALADFHGGVFVMSGNVGDATIAEERGLPFLRMPFDADEFMAFVEQQQQEPTRPGRVVRR